uniref:Uncharacterized protein n=1 Tax=Anguilla anguilla TaxID=7936 RepID=A0A0E9UN75_ANGAN
MEIVFCVCTKWGKGGTYSTLASINPWCSCC